MRIEPAQLTLLIVANIFFLNNGLCRATFMRAIKRLGLYLINSTQW